MRQDWIDIAKGAGIVLVVLGHTVVPHDSWICRVIFAFHIPFFFLISGYLFDDQKYKGQISTLFSNRVRRLLFPYFAAGGILYLYFLCVTYWLSPEDPLTILVMFVKGLAYGVGFPVKQFPTIPPIGTMWFLVSLFTATIIFYGILSLVSRRSLTVQWLAVVLVSLIGYLIGTLVIFLPWNIDIALTAQIFIFAGYRLRQSKAAQEWLYLPLPMLLIFGLFVFTIRPFDMNQRYYGNPLVTFSCAISGSFLLIGIAKRISAMKIPGFNSGLAYLGKMSLIILIYHAQDEAHLHWNTFISWYGSLFKCWPALFMARLVYSVLIIELFKRIPFINRIFFPRQFFASGAGQHASVPSHYPK